MKLAGTHDRVYVCVYVCLQARGVEKESGGEGQHRRLPPPPSPSATSPSVSLALSLLHPPRTEQRGVEDGRIGKASTTHYAPMSRAELPEPRLCLYVSLLFCLVSQMRRPTQLSTKRERARPQGRVGERENACVCLFTVDATLPPPPPAHTRTRTLHPRRRSGMRPFTSSLLLSFLEGWRVAALFFFFL
jgi:hypothetical protein